MKREMMSNQTKGRDVNNLISRLINENLRKTRELERLKEELEERNPFGFGYGLHQYPAAQKAIHFGLAYGRGKSSIVQASLAEYNRKDAYLTRRLRIIGEAPEKDEKLGTTLQSWHHDQVNQVWNKLNNNEEEEDDK